jgi:hypothetical protein
MMQKLINYHVRTALVLDKMITEGRFKELASELNKGNQFRMFDNTDESEGATEKVSNLINRMFLPEF